MSGTTWSSTSAATVDDDMAVEDKAVDPDVVAEEVTDEAPAPIGTLFFMILFLLAMVGLWVTVYWMLLER